LALLLSYFFIQETAHAFTPATTTRTSGRGERSSRHHPTVAAVSSSPRLTKVTGRSAFVPLFAKSKKSASKTDDDDEEPTEGDWSDEDDVDDTVLDEFEEDEDAIDDDDEEDEEEEAGPEEIVAEADDDDDDDDELEIDEIDLDDEDEDDEELVIAAAEMEDEPWESDSPIDWDEDEDGAVYELEDDPTDNDYMKQKELVEQAMEASNKKAADENFDAIDFIQNKMSKEMEQKLQELPFMKQVEELTKDMILTEEDVSGMDLEKEIDAVSSLEDDPYPPQTENNDALQPGAGLTEEDMKELDQTYKEVQEVLNKEPWDKVMLKGMAGFEGLSNGTLAEMEECLREIGGSAYNVTNWLLYDLDFNVSNLILAAVQHNRKAPILFHHWYPQLVTYERYQHARDRNFDFTWEDVEAADVSELERYYAGFGYSEIPQKAPAETGIISLEDLDEEEIKMAAFETWVKEVYNPEGDRKDFDDDDMRDEDNIFSDFYETPQHPDLPTFEDAQDDLAQWEEEIGDDPDMKDYRDMMGRNFEYDIVQDEEFEREFRGHLIIACTGADSDLEIAEKITLRFEKEFGKQVFVETRVMALAQEEDNVYEIWLESYEIDLLHSKKRASLNAKGWDGPADVDDKQIDFLTERVRFLISDDARYSYRLELDHAE